MKIAMMFLFAILSTAHLAIAANEGGNGGDPYEQDFAIAARAAVSAFAPKAHLVPWISMDRLKSRLDGTYPVRIQATDEPLYAVDGELKAAVNYPNENLIKISRQKWPLKALFWRKMALALHELLGLLEYEQSGDYRVTSWFFQKSQAQIEQGYGRLGLLKSGSDYRPIARGAGGRINLETDLEHNQVVLTILTPGNYLFGKSIRLTCESDNAQHCKSQDAKDLILTWLQAKEIELAVMADGHFTFTVRNPNGSSESAKWQPIAVGNPKNYVREGMGSSGNIESACQAAKDSARALATNDCHADGKSYCQFLSSAVKSSSGDGRSASCTAEAVVRGE